MGTATGNAAWQDYPSTATLITAAKLEAIETALDRTLPLAPVPKVGGFLGPFAGDTNGSAGPFDTGTQDGSLIVVGKAITIDQLLFNVDTAEAVNARALLYSCDADGHPATLVADSGGISCSTTGNKSATITPVVLPAGLYHGFIRSNAGTTVRFRCVKQIAFAGVSGTFNDLTAPMNPIMANPGTYASPSATISSWTYGNSRNGNVHPVVGLRRSA